MNCPDNCNCLEKGLNGFRCTFIRTPNEKKCIRGVYVTVKGKPVKLTIRNGKPQKCKGCLDSEKRIGSVE